MDGGSRDRAAAGLLQGRRQVGRREPRRAAGRRGGVSTRRLCEQGHDPQLEKAVEVVMDILAKNPPPKPKRAAVSELPRQVGYTWTVSKKRGSAVPIQRTKSTRIKGALPAHTENPWSLTPVARPAPGPGPNSGGTWPRTSNCRREPPGYPPLPRPADPSLACPSTVRTNRQSTPQTFPARRRVQGVRLLGPHGSRPVTGVGDIPGNVVYVPVPWAGGFPRARRLPTPLQSGDVRQTTHNSLGLPCQSR